MYPELERAARFLVGGVIGLLIVLMVISLAAAQGDNGVMRDWWRSVIRSDGVNCCAEYDAVWADWVGTQNGKYIVRVTGGGPRDHQWAPIGRIYEIDEKFVVWNRGNPLGRPIIFLSPSTLDPICFIPAGGV